MGHSDRASKSHGKDDTRVTCEGIEDPKCLLMGIQDYLLDAEKVKDEGRAFNIKYFDENDLDFVADSIRSQRL